MPALPDHWEVIEEATAEHPFRLATSPARNFLNSTFNETPTSISRERRPSVMIHPDDAAANGIADGAKVVLGNTRGEVRLHAKVFDGVRRGVLIAESIWPNARLRGRPRHQHAHRRRRDRAVWRRRVPRQPGVGEGGLKPLVPAKAGTQPFSAGCPLSRA